VFYELFPTLNAQLGRKFPPCKVESMLGPPQKGFYGKLLHARNECFPDG